MEKSEFKKIGVKNLVLLLLAGVLLLLCTLPDMFRKTKDETEYTLKTTQVIPIELTEEEKLEAILSQVEGVGQVKAMIYSKEVTAEIEGIVIVAEGAGNGKTAAYILDATEALFGIPKHKIIVLPMRIRTEGN